MYGGGNSLSLKHENRFLFIESFDVALKNRWISIDTISRTNRSLKYQKNINRKYK